MAQPIIEVRGISKAYRLGSIGIKSLRDELEGLFRREKNRKGDFLALKDVSFNVDPGEVIGLIGRNGAGKSTLLKILSRITEPSVGEVCLRGRIGSLLEIGTGFHPELSGRDNIYLNGAILGMSRAEIARKFDEIVAFSEVEKFIDTPVKRYSSGMYVRLAFAVAAHLEPEILIVDEVLAVGDQQFQKKCLGKMQDVSRREGRSIIIVSHTMSVILQLAHRCVVLDGGMVKYIGNSEKAVSEYLSVANTGSGVYFNVENKTRKSDGTGIARILELRFPRKLPIFHADECFSFVVKLQSEIFIPKARISITIFGNDGVPIGSCFSDEELQMEESVKAEIHVCLPCPQLAPGSYYCGVAVGKGSHKTGHIDFDVVLDTLQFEVCAAPGENTAISHWCQQWGRIVFKKLEMRKIPPEPLGAII